MGSPKADNGVVNAVWKLLASVQLTIALLLSLGWFGRGADEFYRLYKHLTDKPAGDFARPSSGTRDCPERLKKRYEKFRAHGHVLEKPPTPAEKNAVRKTPRRAAHAAPPTAS